MEITTTTSKWRRSPSHSLGWCGMQAFINQQRQFTMATTSINLKGWTAPLLRMVLDGTLPKPMKKNMETTTTTLRGEDRLPTTWIAWYGTLPEMKDMGFTTTSI